MKISFSRSGGFAAPAMSQAFEIDTDELPESDANELRELLDGAGVANDVTKAATSPRPDALHYRITVSDKGLSHTANASDAEMPKAMQPLVDWLTEWVSRER